MRFAAWSCALVVSSSLALSVACGGSSSSPSDDAGAAGASGGTATAGKSGAAAAGKSGAAGASTGGAAGASAGSAGSSGGAAGASAGSAGSSGGAAGASAGSAGSSGAAAGAAGASAGSAGSSGASAGASAGGSAGAASDAKCTPSMPCQSAGEFCNYSDNLCGATKYVGHCKLRPAGCSAVYSPVCGCDGTVYPNSCSANALGSDLANEGACAPPTPKLFACGPYFCDKATEYCEKIVDLPSIADSYECKSLPPVCKGVASCDCLDKTICGVHECAETPDGGHRTVCPGP